MSLDVNKRVGWKEASLLGVYIITGAILAVPVYRGDAVNSPVEQKGVATNGEASSDIKKESKPVVNTKPKITESVAPSPVAQSLSCKPTQPARTTLAASTVPQIRQLAKYENLCGGNTVSKLSFFIATPTTNAEANSYANFTAKRLLEMSRYGIQPIVFFEPSAAAGVIDLKAYTDGQYDSVLDVFFISLKNLGVTDATMGTWVPVPEGNTPVWSTLDPDTYGKAVTKSISFQKKYFPTSKSSILLSSTTYYGSPEWDDGKSVSLAPYLSAIQPGIVDSFGLQGFPWVAGGNPGITNGSVHDFLRYDLAVDAARILGVKEIWMNTGTFGRKYAGTPRQVAIPDSTRASLLKDIVLEAKAAKRQGYSVAVHLFAEDKASTGEATDWSYLNGSESTASLLKTFVGETQSAGISLWLYDNQR